MMSSVISLKVDVDTYEGMLHGVPRLLDAFRRYGVRATFFLSFGPDRSGLAMLQMLRSPRFAAKMFKTNAASMYGLRTVFSGTLLPARTIAAAFPDVVRRIEREGHEVAIHAWDHRAWQDDLPKFKAHRIQAHYDRSWAAYRAILGHEPLGIGAPAWMTTPESLHLQDRRGLMYASDLRGGAPCRLQVGERILHTPQFPAIGLCIEELVCLGVQSEAALIRGLMRLVVEQPVPQRIVTLHAEVEGGAYLPLLDQLLPRLVHAGEIVTMAEAAQRLRHDLPVRRWGLMRLAGRATPVSTSRA